jgi:hypothetical protein
MMRSLVFGAFDRHNFGDMLFAHVVTALMAGREVRHAGLVDRDLTPWGGHRVEALWRLATHAESRNVIVAGGEVLTCDAFEAAVMLLPHAEAEAAAVRFDHESGERDEWAKSVLAMDRRAPYAPAKAMSHGRLIYNGVGGVYLRARSPALRAEVVDSLRLADFISVRDRVTHEILSSEGIEAALMPDCAALVAEIFGDVIRAHAQRGEAAAVRAAFPGGYIAVQFSSDCADDATLGSLAAQLDALTPDCGIVFFRAGIAPWHDALEPYRRIAQRMQGRRVHVFESAHLWDICALIGGSRAFCGTSLHGRIVATAFGLPAVSFLPPQRLRGVTKQEAYVATWEPLHKARVVEDIAEALTDALATDARELGAHTHWLAQLARDGCARWIAMLD